VELIRLAVVLGGDSPVWLYPETLFHTFFPMTSQQSCIYSRIFQLLALPVHNLMYWVDPFVFYMRLSCVQDELQAK